MDKDIHYVVTLCLEDDGDTVLRSVGRLNLCELQHFAREVRQELYYEVSFSDTLERFLEALSHETGRGDAIDSLRGTVLAASAVRRGLQLCVENDQIRSSEAFLRTFVPVDGRARRDSYAGANCTHITIDVTGPWRVRSTPVQPSARCASSAAGGADIPYGDESTDTVNIADAADAADAAQSRGLGAVTGTAIGLTSVACAGAAMLGAPAIAATSGLLLAGVLTRAGVRRWNHNPHDTTGANGSGSHSSNSSSSSSSGTNSARSRDDTTGSVVPVVTSHGEGTGTQRELWPSLVSLSPLHHSNDEQGQGHKDVHFVDGTGQLRVVKAHVAVDTPASSAAVFSNQPQSSSGAAPTPSVGETGSSPHPTAGLSTSHTNAHMTPEEMSYKTRYEREVKLASQLQVGYEAKLTAARSFEKELLERILQLEKRAKRYAYLEHEADVEKGEDDEHTASPTASPTPGTLDTLSSPATTSPISEKS